MLIRKLALALVLGAAGAGATYAPTASARTFVGVSIGIPVYAPPAPIVERVGVARPGYAWIPGYWNWAGSRYAWVGGYWGPRRYGYRYEASRWVGYGGHWHFRGGRWAR